MGEIIHEKQDLRFLNGTGSVTPPEQPVHF